MGGLVNTSIRFDDGDVINTLVYTSGLQFIFASKAFYERDKAGIKKILKGLKHLNWRNQRLDAVAPYHYGLVVADFKTDTLIDMQGYCSVGRLVLPFDLLYINDVEQYVKSPYYQESEIRILVESILEKRSLKYSFYNPVKCSRDHKTVPENLNTPEEVFYYLKGVGEDKSHIQFLYDTKCKMVSINDHDSDSFLKALKEIEYPIKKREESLFKDFNNRDD